MTADLRATAAATAAGAEPTTAPHRRTLRRSRPRPRGRTPLGRIGVHAFLLTVSLAFLAPLLLAVYASLRPYEETAQYGYFSLPRHLSLDYYRRAYTESGMGRYFTNTLIIAVPAVLITLFLAAFVAFAVSRLRIRGDIVLLILFTAGNLLPQQVIVTPLYVLFNRIPLPWWMSDSMTMYDSYWAVIIVNIGFQIGFCIFVLANFMRTLPQEILEAAIVDGVSVWTQFRRITLPLCRPALAALATLEFTWIYNDFLWALIFISDPDKLPITSSLNSLRGQFFTDYNLLAAGSVLVALPTIVVFLLLQRHFIAGLTLGSTKG
ncbi:carbohydrate ABC transporter permease [Streptomyces sp. NPDC002004]